MVGFGENAVCKPGASCDHCSTAIVDCFWFVSKDGQRFKVGSDCVRKSDDKGLVNLITREVNKLKTARRHEKESEKIAHLKAIMQEPATRAKLAELPHPNEYMAREKKATYLDYVEWMIKNSGNAGKLKILRAVEKMQGEAPAVQS